MLDFKQALTLIHHGMAEFISQGSQRNSAIRLTYSKIAQLRDQSLKITEQILIAFADDSLFESTEGERGKRNGRARAAIGGWEFSEPVTEVPAAYIEASKQQIQCFR